MYDAMLLTFGYSLRALAYLHVVEEIAFGLNAVVARALKNFTHLELETSSD